MLEKSKEVLYRQLIAAAKATCENAYQPYSNFPVGAAVLTFDGRIFTGCNVENAGYTVTIHAEMTAVVKAISEGVLRDARAQGLTKDQFIKAIAIHAPKGTPGNPWPCCICRQFLCEFGLDLDVIGEGPKGPEDAILCEPLRLLIPHPFVPEEVLPVVHGKR